MRVGRVGQFVEAYGKIQILTETILARHDKAFTQVLMLGSDLRHVQRMLTADSYRCAEGFTSRYRID